MATIGRWNGFKFTVSSSMIQSFNALTIKGSCETKEKKKNKQSYVKRKSGKPNEVSLTVVLNAGLGCDVRADAMKLVSYATAGKKGYFYVGTGKLMACKLMLVDASIKEIQVGTGNTWINAEVQLTMKQSNKGSAASGSNKRKKKSVKKSSSRKRPKSTKQPGSSDEVDAISGAAPSVSAKISKAVKKVVSSAVASISRITTAAKKQTKTQKTAPKVVKPAIQPGRLTR